MGEMPALRYDLHRDIEDTHWWFLARRAIIMDVLSLYLPPDKGRIVVEVGCGTGGNLSRLKEHYRAIGTEISARAADLARARTGCPVFLGDGLDGLKGMAGGIDGVLLLDLLEHLHDPPAFLKKIHGSLPDDAILIVTVPAGQWSFSEHDLAFGHLRRYSGNLLRRELQQAGFAVVYLSHFNTLLYPPAMLIRLIRKLLLPLRKGSQYKTDFWTPPPPFNKLFAAIMGAERFLMRKWPLPWGMSLIAVVRKERRGDTPRP